METWEILVAGLIALGVIFWFRPGIKAGLKQSREAPKDWRGVIIPLALVVLFVILMIASVR